MNFRSIKIAFLAAPHSKISFICEFPFFPFSVRTSNFSTTNSYGLVQSMVRMYASKLRDYGDIKNLAQGRQIHIEIVENGLQDIPYLAHLLLRMYGKCGCVEDANRVFCTLWEQDVVLWTTMIAAYAQHGHRKEALLFFNKMQEEEVRPNRVTFVSILNACTLPAGRAEGKLIHASITSVGFESDIVMGNALAHMYSECANLDDSYNIFVRMPQRNVVSWTTLISLYAVNNLTDEAQTLFREMQRQGVEPNSITIVSILNACSGPMVLPWGRCLHAYILNDHLESNQIVQNAVMNMYSKCGSLEDAQKIFSLMPEKNTISWNAIIGVYAQCQNFREALLLFRRMQREGIEANDITFVNLLSACFCSSARGHGKLVNSCIVHNGSRSDAVGNVVVNMYGRCAALADAYRSFRQLTSHDIVSWTTIIAIYTQHGYQREVLDLFGTMRQEGVVPNKVTFISLFDSCTYFEFLREGILIHAYFLELGLDLDVATGNSLVNMYGKCGELSIAHSVFDNLPIKDVISWTALIGAYTEHGYPEVSLHLFGQMQQGCTTPSSITFIAVFDACAILAALREGMVAHAEANKLKLDYNIALKTALINMYRKSGNVEEAYALFDKMPKRNVASWTAVIATLAENYHDEGVFQLFQQMQQEHIDPDAVMFLSALSACSHAGLLHEGWQLFVSMFSEYGIVPQSDHYNCMIDILGRIGCLDEAEDLVRRMPFVPDTETWRALLGACKKHHNIELGKQVAEIIMDSNPQNPAAYILVSNLHAGKRDIEILA